ncbi:MAG: N-carbamoylputrescine amidase [Deltaproteobacteria bacterium]|jgi:N-carbamoylputrescine amidase|nr:N-carbamoylputrescine amidase [Deltaproteobacteria bacterium]
MAQSLTVAALQTSFGKDLKANVARVTELVHTAADRGAQVILPSELFESPYFCKVESEDCFALAQPMKDHPTILHFQKVARERSVAIPVSFFELDGQCYYNSIAMLDADGSILGLYRKSHIPDGPGYEEKFYFRPGDTGFKVWSTIYGRIGVGICWDQWFPECARAMMLQGADVLLYPTAIGNEPHDPTLDTKDLWQRAMIGHAVSNVVPVIAANRIGNEDGQIFYGHSFISDHRGNLVAELGRTDQGVITGTFDLDQVRKHRAAFGFFRDRRPSLYSELTK